ncbi:hypothetical protein KFL_002480030 [Klebsormidium nitens]|uniref:Uncharacterized protein n=1 Tax=Klebsormidium nitens TaxID=105231 RepID=A0A1Y1I400_KLENI|nr:hypothetical protein KFL_002480030 [Klebsormidium nitens]|eukprot:GAQ85665.1 hypothetical protein KFL_002480030 [Klebsormidium nitens]
MAEPTMVRLSLRAEPAEPVAALEQSSPEDGAAPEKQETAPAPGFSVSYSVLGQPEGQAEALPAAAQTSLVWEKELPLVVDEAFVRTAAAAYGRVCIWLRPGSDPPPAAKPPPGAKEGSKDRSQSKSGKGAEPPGKGESSNEAKASGKGAPTRSTSIKPGGSKSVSPAPPVTSSPSPELGVGKTEHGGCDGGPPRGWGEKEGACLLVLEAAPLLANRMHVERSFSLEGGAPQLDLKGGLGVEAAPSLAGALSVAGVLKGYSKVVVTATLTQKLLPDPIAAALNPVVLTPLRLYSLPDQPASAHALDTLCQPPRVELRLPGVHKAFSRTATSLPWRAPSSSPRGASSVPLQVRDAVFDGPPCILLAGLLPAGSLYEDLTSAPLEVRILDRSLSARGNAPASPSPEPAQAPSPGETPPPTAAPANATGDRPRLPDSCGVARLSLSELCRGEADVKTRAPVYPVGSAAALAAGEENDWRTRPGLYMQAGSSIALRVEAAVPLAEAPGTTRPFGRIVVRLAYADGPVLNAVLAEVRAVNAATLRLAGEERHVLTTLATMQLTPAQQTSPELDVITGLQAGSHLSVIDGEIRLLLLEGLRSGSYPRLEAMLRREQAAAPEPLHVLSNPDVGFRERLYGTLGADVQPFKLRASLAHIASDPNGAIAGRLKPECHEGVIRLEALAGMTRLRKAAPMFPSAVMVEAVYRKYGGELTSQDVTGRPEEPTANAAAAETSADEGESGPDAEGGSPRRGRATAARKGHTDNTNDEFMRTRRARATKNQHKENLARIGALSEKAHAVRAALRARQRAVLLEEEKNTPRERSPTFDTTLHNKPFFWPAPREAAAFRTLPNHPSEARTEELNQPWEEPLTATLSREGDPDSLPFQTVVAPANGALFERDGSFFTSVFTAADSLAKKKTIGRDDSNPSGPRFDTVTPLRKTVGQLDKLSGLLRDPPRKPGLTGRARLDACPVSALSAEPYVEGAQETAKVDPAPFTSKNVDFRRHISPPRSTVAKRAITEVTASEKAANPAFQQSALREPIQHQSVFKVTSWYGKPAAQEHA